MKRTKEALEKARSGAPAAPPSPISKRIQEAEGPVELAPISNVPITLRLTADTKVIYQSIGKLAGVNVLFDPDYTPRTISVELNGVTLTEALDVLALESKTFWRPVTPNTIFVASDTPAKRRELEQSVIRTFYLSNISAPTELQDMVNAMRTILEVNRVQPLASQGAIVIRATPDQVALAEKLISDLDRAKPEVIIDVAVMQVRRDRLRDLGIRPPGTTSISLQGSTTGTGTDSTGTPNTINLNRLPNLKATDFVVTIPGVTANFLFNDAASKVIQNPQIRALDGQKASLKIGDRVPVATGSFQPGIGGVGINPLVNTQFQYIDVGVNIDITPRVHAGREVTLKLMLDISSVTSRVNIGGIDQPVIGQRKIEHEIRLKEGEVNLLGGIFEEQEIRSLGGIPGLGQIPLLRYLFSEERKEKTENEIVFALVPHIVRAQEVTELNTRALDVGTGTSIDLRRRPPANGTPGGGAAVQGRPQTAPAQARAMPSPPITPPPAQAAPPPPVPQQATGAQPAATPGTVSFSFDPPAINQTTGSTFPVNVVMTGGQSIFSVPLQITYDANTLELVNVSNGPFLSQDGQPVALVHRDDPAAGTLQLTATRPPASGGVSGDGVVFTLTLQAKAPGQSVLAITRPGARNATMQAVPGTASQATLTIR
jgi:general secretion pathway protein D